MCCCHSCLRRCHCCCACVVVTAVASGELIVFSGTVFFFFGGRFQGGEHMDTVLSRNRGDSLSRARNNYPKTKSPAPRSGAGLWNFRAFFGNNRCCCSCCCCCCWCIREGEVLFSCGGVFVVYWRGCLAC